MLSLQERRRALEAAHPVWRPATLAGALDAAARRFPDRPLILTAERSFTYAEVRDWSERLARGLIASGVQPGEHVALVLANHPEFVALKFAIARAGAVAVPINYLLRSAELGYVLRQCDASLLVCLDRFRDLDYLAMLDELAPGWERAGGGSAFPRLREVAVFSPDGSRRPGALSLDALEARGTGVDGRELDRAASAVTPRDNADIVYTSGTSGSPKGVMLSHDALLRSAYGSAWTRGFGDGRRILFALPLYHVFAYVEGLLASLFAGGAIIPQTTFDAVGSLEAIERHRADEALFVPTMTLAVLQAAGSGNHDVSSLHTVMSAAAPAPARVWQAVREVLGVSEVLTAYGMTETSAATTYTEPDGPLELVAATVGRPKLGGVAGDPALGGQLAAYKTVDPLSGADLAPGAEGELAVHGPIVTHGYYEKPQETAAVLDDAGWLRSGDLGRVAPHDGSLVLTGRSKELYKCGGELVAPKEVEELLCDHPAVAQAYLVGLPDERMGEIGCAWVVPEGEAPDPDELLEHCRRRLARFKVPAHVLYLQAADLPTTATGKVQKFRLIERAQTQLEGGAGGPSGARRA